MEEKAQQLSLIISQIREATPQIGVYQLRNKNGGDLPLVTAGSYLEIGIQQSNRKSELRKYFLCSNPNQRDVYEIAVPLEATANSKLPIEFDPVVGAEFDCNLPANNFHLHADASPAVLIAEHIGIAPIITIAYTLAARGRRFTLHYSGSSKSEMAFVEELQSKFPRQIHFYAVNEAQQIDTMQLLAEAPGNSVFYICGSQQMLEAIDTHARTLGISKDRIQQEYFFSTKPEKDKAVVLELACSNKLLQVRGDQPLLAALRDAGVPARFDCCVGDCGTCAVKILEGEAEHRDHVLSDAQKAEGFICVCVSRSKTEKLVLAI
jgi:ferredoxin-NADP reductase